MPVNRRRVKWLLAFALGVAVAVYLLLPRRVLIVPEVEVSVLGPSGGPVSRVVVTRSYAHYSVEPTSQRDDAVTDESGVIRFDKREMRLSRAVEWGAALRKQLRSVDSGAGARWWVIVDLPGKVDTGTPLLPEPSDGERVAWRCVVGAGCQRTN